ncbi:initiation factor 2 [Massarina eburnea CBS 473.64]|uniref:Translation initiation factor IF-2, mitochondrial n=1 Tax=Massarina eburnea CBS 473.64 TaxID=1395130 RepID=A0A6A6S0C1_9PLEO|nr:initiation factor 2 [Massarina eburnea CBS 473.64]
MRNTSRALRISSTRDVCIFCATRQLAAEANGSIVSPNPAQRRHLNSSSKAPQYASEGQAYKQSEAPARPMTQAEKMRALLQATMPKPAPSPPPPPQRASAHNDSPREGSGASPYRATGLARQNRQNLYGQRVPLPQRNALPRRNSVFNEQRGPTEGNGPPGSMDSRPPMGADQRRPPGGRYQVNMDSRPLVRNVAPFETGNLRRRNETPPNRSAVGTAPSEPLPFQRAPLPVRIRQNELDELLGNASKQVEPRKYTPLQQNTSVRPKCMHCGREDHLSVNCPTAPVLRETSAPRNGKSYNEAVDEFFQKRSSTFESAPLSVAEQEDRRRHAEEQDRRRNKFRFDDGNMPAERMNRFEEPQRRNKTNYERRTRRVMRDDDEDFEQDADKAELRRQRKEAKKKLKQETPAPTPVYLPQFISVTNLASLLRVRVEDFVAKLEDLGFEEVQNDHILNAEHAGLIAQEYNFEPVVQKEGDAGDLRPAPALSPDEYAQLPARPPVVTIMGHVDHGKTTILDYIRSTTVAASEFGGITQHIGAFSVSIGSGKNITFLDTPGHSAFETMRARGANVTDIVVLVVAADDSVMPQTIEAIKHAQAANVPMIVAINKIDIQQADPDAVKLDLGRHGIEVEDFGGDIQAIPVSGLTGKGMPDLEEAISTLSEMLDHRADPTANVEGWVIEGTTKKSGKVATVLIRNGTLRVGDILVAGTTWTRVRTLRNEAGITVNEVGPGMPVEVDGWREQPIAGDEVLQAANEQQGQYVADLRMEKLEREQMAKDMDAINESRRLEAERREAERREAERREAEEADTEETANGEGTEETVKKETGPAVIPFIVKGDVSGSVEAVIDSISGLGNGEISTRILRHGVGSPSEFDVQHAADARGHIINFNTSIPNHISAMAERGGVKILDSNIIYRVVEKVKTILEDRLPPRITHRVIGEADIAMVFTIGLGGRKKMAVAGSKVRNGVVEKGAKVKVLRKDAVVFQGVINSLKNQKKDVNEMRKDTECGIGFEGWADFKEGDKVQCYVEEFSKRTL